jgi:sugar lactone lactonase YvrE
LFVTTAQYNMTAAERAQDPHAGSLFSVELDDVSGLPADRFAI